MFKQTTKTYDFCDMRLRVNICEVSVYTVRTFMKYTHVCLLIVYQIINKTQFPSLADEIAEPRPEMNIKVAAFTVDKKSIIVAIRMMLS